MDSIDHDGDSLTATNITSLPGDLLLMVFRSDAIDGDDLASLRLACSVLSRAATMVLFRRIRISQLRRDRDAFLAICHSPHLAEHVRELEWQEISWYPGYASLVIRPGRSSLSQHKLEDDEEFWSSVDTLASELFWLQVVPNGEKVENEADIASQRQKAIEEFRGEFLRALGHLPRLSTIISRPMSADRTLNWSQYPFSAKFFQSHHLLTKDSGRKSLSHTNDGLFLFLLPAIDSSAISINRLVWEDESPAGSYLREPNPGAFQHLDTLVLTLSPQQLKSYENLTVNLQGATNVRNLSLGVVEGSSYGHLELAMLRYCQETRETGWSRLHSLSLHSMRKVQTALVDVIEQNADTLRHVYFSNCRFRIGEVKKLAEIPNLRLASFRVQDIEHTSGLISETEVLSFINKETGLTDMPSFLDIGSRDENSWYIMTTHKGHDEDSYHYENASICSEASSLDSLGYRLADGPKWDWGRYDNEDGCGNVYYYQVDGSSGSGNPTICWKFTNRDGEVAYGNEPLNYFTEWDIEAGDVEEPTPYCSDLMEFAEGTSEGVWGSKVIWYGSTGREALGNQEPPEGAILFDRDEARTAADMCGSDVLGF